MQSATSSDFVPLAARTATATWPSVQFVICSFASLFLRQLVTQSSIAATCACKAVVSYPSEICRCILLWYLQIPAPVPCWLQVQPCTRHTLFWADWTSLGPTHPLLVPLYGNFRLITVYLIIFISRQPDLRIIIIKIFEFVDPEAGGLFPFYLFYSLKAPPFKWVAVFLAGMN